MKKRLCLLITLALLLSLLTGCYPGTSSGTAPETPDPTEAEIAETNPPATEAPTEPPVPATEPPTEPTAPVETPFPVPYLQEVTQADESIFTGPGYDYNYVGTVEIAGVYTIVTEVQDTHGSLWGKLKSGVGWINLTHVRSLGGEPMELQEEATEPPFSPYLLNIPWNDEPIYAGPGYNYAYVCTVGKAGIYTIVEEEWDPFGNHWGKLKSGIGWVDLGSFKESNPSPGPLMAADFAYNLPGLGEYDYHHYTFDTSDYAVKVVFWANQTLYNVQLFSTHTTESDLSSSKELLSLETMTPSRPLLVDLFFGDLTQYKIRFEDASGTVYVYYAYISGRDGSLVFSVA